MVKIRNIFVLLLLIICVLRTAKGFRKQGMRVRGKVFCPSNPRKAAGIRVKLVDEDDGPDPDDTMASVRTNRDGSFQLEGSTRELTRIDPRLKIYHDCNDGFRPCSRKWKFKLPTNYINSNKWFEVGVINLELILRNEERDCIH